MTGISNLKQNTIALFGGAFDPPHVGHALAIRQILDTGMVDAVWVVPTGKRPDKESTASGEARLHMVSLLISELFANDPVFVKDHLIHEALPTTYDELQYLAKTNPNHRFSVAIGRDQALALTGWHHYEELRQIARFLVLVRDGRPIPDMSDAQADIIDPDSVAWMNCSSTEIRKRLAENIHISGMVPGAVERFIRKEQLYQTRSQKEGSV